MGEGKEKQEAEHHCEASCTLNYERLWADLSRLCKTVLYPVVFRHFVFKFDTPTVGCIATPYTPHKAILVFYHIILPVLYPATYFICSVNHYRCAGIVIEIIVYVLHNITLLIHIVLVIYREQLIPLVPYRQVANIVQDW